MCTACCYNNLFGFVPQQVTDSYRCGFGVVSLHKVIPKEISLDLATNGLVKMKDICGHMHP